MTKRTSLGVALGGGGARGAAHIGALQEMTNARIKIDMVAGVSAGSVIAAMYAFSQDPFWIEDRFRKLWSKETYGISKKVFSTNKKPKSFLESIKKQFIEYSIAILNLHKNSILNKDHLEEVILSLVPVKNFKELMIPLKIVATNLENGEDVIYDDGDLIPALVQSCSIPGIFSPTFSGDKIISDGGVSMPVPVSILKQECDFTVVIDIGQYKLSPLDSSNAKSISKRANIITSNRLKHLLSLEADFVIRPDTLGKEWSDFDACEDLFKQGRISTSNIIQELKTRIDHKTVNAL